MSIISIGGLSGPATNSDCYNCAKSFIEKEITSEYEPDEWFSCKEGHKINCQYDEDNKGCKLPKGSYFKLEYSIHK